MAAFRIVAVIVTAVLAACVLGCAAQPKGQALAEGGEVERRVVDELLAPFVSTRGGKHKAPGIFVGISRHGRRAFYGYGEASRFVTAQQNHDGVVEMGSITKVFTCLLVALHAVRSGDTEKFLEQPVARILPTLTDHWRSAPLKQAITLEQLATHTSGFPFRLPPNVFPRDSDDFDLFFEALARAPNSFRPGHSWMYSNPGIALLGAAAARLGGRDFEELVAGEIVEPLGLSSTGKFPKGRYVEGYDVDERTGAFVRVGPTVAGKVNMATGGLRSTGSDLLRFAEALRSPPDTEVGRAIELAKRVRLRVPCPGGNPGSCGMAMGLQTMGSMHYKTGQTDGFFSVIAFDDQTSLVLSANQTDMHPLVGAARKLLDALKAR